MTLKSLPGRSRAGYDASHEAKIDRVRRGGAVFGRPTGRVAGPGGRSAAGGLSRKRQAPRQLADDDLADISAHAPCVCWRDVLQIARAQGKGLAQRRCAPAATFAHKTRRNVEIVSCSLRTHTP